VRNLWTVVSSLRASPNVCRLRRHSCPKDQRPGWKRSQTRCDRRRNSDSQEAAVIRTLKSVSAKGSVEELGKQLALVESASVVTDPQRSWCDKSYPQYKVKLRRLEVYRLDIPTRLSAVLNLRSLDEIQSDILRHVNLYEGTAFAPEIENALSAAGC